MIDSLPLDPLINLLWALNFEAGIYIANADDDATQKDMVSTLERVLAGLRPSRP